MKKLYYYQALVRLLTVTCCFFSVIAAADENNLTKQLLIEQAEYFVLNQLDTTHQKNISVKAMPIDKRIKIPSCGTPFNFSASEDALNQSNVTVKADCHSSDWYMFLVVKATITQPVVVISSAVSPGTLLTRNNVKIVNMDKKRIRTSTFADINEVLGAKIKRRLMPGRPVSPSNLCYVCKGDNVTIIAAAAGMQVKTSGVALEDGNMGETIRVKNTRSSKKVHARVASTNRVEISI